MSLLPRKQHDPEASRRPASPPQRHGRHGHRLWLCSARQTTSNAQVNSTNEAPNTSVPPRPSTKTLRAQPRSERLLRCFRLLSGGSWWPSGLARACGGQSVFDRVASCTTARSSPCRCRPRSGPPVLNRVQPSSENQPQQVQSSENSRKPPACPSSGRRPAERRGGGGGRGGDARSGDRTRA